MSRKAIFIDRDGTLIADKDYLHKPEEVEFIPGALPALARAAQAGFAILMITNQSGVGRGYFTLEDVKRVHDYISRQSSAEQVEFLQIYIAPEHPDEPSRGRKPSPQFLLDARDEFDLDLSQSYMIGDKLIDLEAGWNAGVRRSILVRTGYGAKVEERDRAQLRDAIVVDHLSAAIDWILTEARQF